MALYLGNAKVGLTTPPTLKHITMRPDAELIQTYTHDSMLVADDEIELPVYSTTAKTLVAVANLTPTVSIDLDEYDYFISERILTIPEYNITTLAKGRQEYSWSVYNYEIIYMPANTFNALIDPAETAARTQVVFARGCFRDLYYSSATAVALYTATTYGLHQVIQAPTVTATVLTIKAPSVTIRGSTTYFADTFYNALTDCRREFIIDVYRAPKKSLNYDGWDLTQGMLSIANDIKNNNGTLR